MRFWHSSASNQCSDEHAHTVSPEHTVLAYTNMYVDEESVQILDLMLRWIRQYGHLEEARPRGYNTFSMLNSAEYEFYPAHKC